MYKKIIIFSAGILMGFLILSQIGAISNWTQMLTASGDWGIWSPRKSNTTTLPNMIITTDGKVGVGLTQSRTLTDSYFKSGDIIAKRICFEDTHECHSSIANTISNNVTFNNIISKNIAFEDYHGTIPYGKDRLRPFYIRVTPEFLNTVGLDPNYGTGEYIGDQATNWFDIGETYGVAHENVPKSLWAEVGSNMGTFIKKVNGPYNNSNPDHHFIACQYKNNQGAVVNSYDPGFCSSPNNRDGTPRNILYHSYCEANLQHCGILELELRITTGNRNVDRTTGNQPEECRSEQNSNNYMGQGPLAIRIWSDPELLFVKNTPFKSPITNATYTPSWCGTYPISMWIGLQGRFVLSTYNRAKAQSLTKYIQGGPKTVKINKTGITYLR